MTLSKLRRTLLYASVVYVWVNLHPQDGVWLKVPKSVIFDYLEELTDDTEFLADLKNDELYIGKEA